MKIKGFNEDGSIAAPLLPTCGGLLKDGSYTFKYQMLMLHNHVYELTLRVEQLEKELSKIKRGK